MATTPIAQLEALARTLYKDGVPEIGYTDTPAWGSITKTSTFFGKSKEFSSRFGKTPGASRTYARSRANSGASPFAKWIVTRSKDFVTVQFDVETFEALGNQEGAQTNYVEEETTSAQDQCAQRIERNFFRNIGGSQGTILAGGGTPTITLTDPSMVMGLDVGMWLDSDTTDGSAGGAVDNAAPFQISAINRVTGTVTRTGGNWNAGGGFGNGDHIFVNGDFGLALAGLDAWIPSTDPGATPFFGLDRSVDPQRLGGTRYTANAVTDGNVLNALISAGALTNALGGKTKIVFMESIDFGTFVKQLGDNAQYTVTPGQSIDGKKLDVGYEGVRVMLPSGTAVVHPNRHCQKNTAWLLDPSDISFEGMKQTPRWMDLDGGKWIRMTHDNVHGVEGYLYYSGQFVVRSPGMHARVNLTAVL